MSAHLIQARRNRVLALHTVAARNSGSSDVETAPETTIREARRARFSVVEGSAPSPWMAEDGLAA